MLVDLDDHRQGHRMVNVLQDREADTFAEMMIGEMYAGDQPLRGRRCQD
ncbi:hypothetical protein ACQEVF_14170 [Nonomuraea polychroma]